MLCAASFFFPPPPSLLRQEKLVCVTCLHTRSLIAIRQRHAQLNDEKLKREDQIARQRHQQTLQQQQEAYERERQLNLRAVQEQEAVSGHLSLVGA